MSHSSRSIYLQRSLKNISSSAFECILSLLGSWVQHPEVPSLLFISLFCRQDCGGIFLINHCSGLKENGPKKDIGSSTSVRCNLVGVGVSLGAGSEVSDVQARPNVALSLPAACGFRCKILSYFSSTMSVCMLPCTLP